MRIFKTDPREVKVKHEVDERTVIIGRGEKVSKKETLQMLEKTIDTTQDSNVKNIYEKVYMGVKKFE